MKFEEYNEDYGRNEFGSHLEEQLEQETALESVLMEEELDDWEEVPLRKEYKCVKDYLDAPLNDEREAKLKKLFAAASVIAKAMGVLPPKVPVDSAWALSSTVDSALTRTKVAYQVGAGQIAPIEAADALIDSAAAQTAVIADAAIEKGAPIVLERIIDFISLKLPAAQALKPYARAIAQHVTPVVKQAVRTGIKVVVTAAKATVRTIVTGIKRVANKVHNWLKA